jgi:hypothetical protein
MAKVCLKCGASANEDESLFCIKCGAQLPLYASELKNGNGQTIKESLNTQLPRSSNELKTSPLCPSCGTVLNQNSPYCPKCFVIVNPQLVDKTIAPKTSGNPLLCNICGAAIKQNSAYCPECKTIYTINDVAAAKKRSEEEELMREEVAKKAAIFQNDIAQENIVKLQDSGNFYLIYNFITRYPNSNITDQNFFNLKTVLAKRGIILTDLELSAVISKVKQEGELEWVKTRILDNNPTSSDGCIKNWLFSQFGIY